MVKHLREVSIEKSLFPTASNLRAIHHVPLEVTRFTLPAQRHLLSLESLFQLALPRATLTMVTGVDGRRYMSPGVQRDLARTLSLTLPAISVTSL